MSTSQRGFASCDRQRQREISSLGGKAVHVKGTGHEWDREAARAALAKRRGQESAVIVAPPERKMPIAAIADVLIWQRQDGLMCVAKKLPPYAEPRCWQLSIQARHGEFITQRFHTFKAALRMALTTWRDCFFVKDTIHAAPDVRNYFDRLCYCRGDCDHRR